MEIGFVRHGNTNWNLEGRAQGRADIPLNARGVHEAEQVAQRLGSGDWNVIYSSDLSRAKATAEAISRQMPNVDLYFDKRLQERSVGLIEGMTESDRIAKWGNDWRSADLGMESGTDVVDRSLAFLNELVARHKDQNILIVSHGGVIKRLLVHLFPYVDPGISLGNTSVSQVSIHHDRWELALYNSSKHLSGTVDKGTPT